MTTQQKVQAFQVEFNGQDMPVVAGTQGQVLTVGSPETTTIWTNIAGGGSGDVVSSGTPVDNQLAVWTNATTIEGNANLTFDGSFLQTNRLNLTGSGTRALGALQIESDQPFIYLQDTSGAGVDGANWDIGINNGTLRIATGDDADGFGAEALTITRSGTAPQVMTLNVSSLQTTGDLWIRDGNFLRISDSTDADNIEFIHNGTDVLTTFVGTTAWEINTAGTTSGVAFTTNGAYDFHIDSANNNIDIRNGYDLRIYEDTDTNFSTFNQTGTQTNMVAGGGTVRFDFEGYSTVDIQGADLRIRNTTEGGDFATIGHDGTDFDIDLTNTRDFSVNGMTRNFVVGDSNAVTIPLTNGPWTGSADHAIALETTTNNDNVELHLAVAEGNNNRRARFFLSDETGEFGLQASASTGVPNFGLYIAATKELEVSTGGVDVTGALTATSYGGILEGNLIDKTAPETLTGLITFQNGGGGAGSSNFIRGGGNNDQNFAVLFGASYDSALVPLIRGYGGSAPTNSGLLRATTPAGGDMEFAPGAGGTFEVQGTANVTGALTALSFGGIASGNLLDKSATETVSGAYTFTSGTATTFTSTNGIILSGAGEGLDIKNGGSRIGNPTKGGHTPNDTRVINLRDGNPPTDGALLITNDSSSVGDAGNEILYISSSIFEFNGNDVLTSASSIPATSVASGNLGSGVLPYVGVSGNSGSFRVPFINTQGNAAGNFGLFHDNGGNLTYNPSTNTLATGTFSGNLSGNATTATTATNSTQLGGIAAANFARADTTDTIAGNWTFTNSASIGFRAGINGDYSSTGSSTTWGASIWALDTSFDGATAGNNSASTSMYGIRWLRGSHTEANSFIGEGLYVYNNGTQQGGMGLNGLSIDNINFTNRITIGNSTTRVLETPTLRGTINVGGPTQNGGVGSYHGYSINNEIMFMHNGDDAGIYDEVNNQWKIRFDTDNVNTVIYGNGAPRISCGVANGTFVVGDLDIQGGSITVDQDERINAGNLLDIFSTSNDSIIRSTGTAAGNDMFIQVNNGSNGIVIRNQAEVELYHGNVEQLSTQDNDAAGITSGAQVRAHDGTFRDVGFNTLEVETEDANVTIGAQHCGSVYLKDATTTRTVTLPSSSSTDFPVHGITTLINATTSGNINVNEGSGTTLFYLDGSTRTDTAGGAVIGPGGVATVWREATNIFYIWGAGITP